MTCLYHILFQIYIIMVCEYKHLKGRNDMIQVKTKTNTDFLFTSHVLDYGDNYHRQTGEPSSELEREARKIRRRYRQQHEYLKALAVYNEYMSLIIEKNGGKQLFKLQFKDGLITDFIPHKPRMKNTKLNRALEKYKIIISDPAKNVDIDYESAKAIANQQKPVWIEFSEDSDSVAEKMITGGLSLTSTTFNANDPIDYLEAYFAKKRTTEKDKNKVVKNPSLTDLLTDNTDDDYEENMDDIVYYRGSMMNRGNVQQLARMEELNSLGWNSLKIMKQKNANGSITKILKKKKKRAKKDKKKRKAYNSFMVNVMGDNNDFDDFDMFENDMLNFTSKNIFK